MKRDLAWLAGALALFTLAAWWRWPDSAHAMGALKQGGGAARHPVRFDPGRDRYSLVATTPVIPPYRGDVRVSLQGDPPIPFTMELGRPIVDLGLHAWPRQEGNVLRGVQPLERLTLWVQLEPRAPAAGSYRLAFHDEASGKPLLSIPVLFATKEEAHAAAHHH